MYKLLIVDDEILIQVGLRSMIDYASLGIQIVGVAGDGESAVQKIIELQPDIVLLDIHMPSHSGIEVMSEVAKQVDIPPVYIILTSHEQFEYARQALQYGAVNYLLKIELNADTLTAALQSALTTLSGLKRRHDPDADVAPLSGEAAQELFFTRLINNWFSSPQDIEHMADYYGIDCRSDCYTVAYVTIARDGSSAKADSPTTSQYVQDMLREACSKFSRFYLIPWNYCSFLIVFLLDQKPDWNDPHTMVLACVRHAQGIVARYLGLQLLAGLGQEVGSLEQLAEAFKSGMSLNGMCSADDPIQTPLCAPAKASQDGFLDLEAYERRLKDAIDVYDVPEIRKQLETIEQRIAASQMTVQDAIAVCVVLLHFIMVVYCDAAALLSELWNIKGEVYQNVYFQLHQLSTTREICDWLAALRDGLCARIQNDYERNHHWLVHSIKEYINSHYSEPITLSTVADEFNVSRGYISTQFMKYTDSGFYACVMQAKIKHAQELLQEPCAKITNVSYQLGYSDPYYFSKVFKRVVGVSPKEYMNAHKRQG